MKIVYFGVVFVVLLLVDNCENARILGVFPTPSISHQVVFHALVKDLAARGHHVTILTTDALKTDNPNITEINLHDSSYDIFNKEINFVELKAGRNDEEKFVRALIPALIKVIDKQLEHPAVKNIIEKRENQTFDVVIVEHLLYSSTLAFAEIYDCPIIGITSFDTVTFAHEAVGNEANPVIHPDIFLAYSHGQLSFVERWKSLTFYFFQLFLFSTEYERDYMIQIRKHFPTVTASLSSMRERIQLVMTNTHPAMGFIKPILPNTIQLGFMHIEPPSPLPDSDLKTFLENSRNGVIYMSLGSNVKSKDLSPEILAIFLTVFRNLTYNVVWKFEADNLPNKPDNVFISKWLPQSDFLAHPSIKLFITQGGQQSMEEAIDRTVPMIVIPFLGDQDANAKRMVQKGIGHHLELHTLTEAKLRGAITEMLKPIYKHNIQKLKELVNDQPMTSREKAVWWTEYVIRHNGAKHLEYPGRLVPFYQRYCLDFICIGFGLVGLLFTFISAVLRRYFSSKKSKIE